MKITDEELIINVHHIGGIGDCGPIEILDNLNESVLWTYYDAEPEALNSISLKGKNYKLINKCIGGSDSKINFNILANASASSCLLCADSAKDYVVPGYDKEGKPHLWGEHTKLIKTIETDANKLDTLINNKTIDKIDLLSIDTQGLDYEILRGVEENMDSIVSVICEVEFSPLYEGQKLFDDINSYLRKNDFRLCELLNVQHFNYTYYPYCNRGKGFLTVAEAVFLKNPNHFLNDERLRNASEEEKKKIVISCIKLATAGLTFNQPDFAFDIINQLEARGLISLNELVKNSEHYYLKTLKHLMKGTLLLRFVE
jgi:FkbM family methyltransferase